MTDNQNRRTTHVCDECLVLLKANFDVKTTASMIPGQWKGKCDTCGKKRYLTEAYVGSPLKGKEYSI